MIKWIAIIMALLMVMAGSPMRIRPAEVKQTTVIQAEACGIGEAAVRPECGIGEAATRVPGQDISTQGIGDAAVRVPGGT